MHELNNMFQSCPDKYRNGEKLFFPLGTSANGVLYDSFYQKKNLFVVGWSGYGKTCFIQTILHSFSNCYSAERVRFLICGASKGEYDEYQEIVQLPHMLCEEFNDFKRFIEFIREESDKRVELFQRGGVKDIYEFNHTQLKRIPQLVCVFDSYINYNYTAAEQKYIYRQIELIEKDSAISGIHLIFSSQRFFPIYPHICNIFDTIAMFHLDYGNIPNFQNMDLRECRNLKVGEMLYRVSAKGSIIKIATPKFPIT